MKLSSEQLKARMEYAEGILRRIPKLDQTIAIVELLNRAEDSEDADDMWEAIQAQADIRARQAVFEVLASSSTASVSGAQLDECFGSGKYPEMTAEQIDAMRERDWNKGHTSGFEEAASVSQPDNSQAAALSAEQERAVWRLERDSKESESKDNGTCIVYAEDVRTVLAALSATTPAQSIADTAGAKLDLQAFAEKVRDGIADYVADNMPDRKHSLSEIDLYVRKIEINAAMIASPAIDAAGASSNEHFEAWAMREGLISESHGVRFVNSMCDIAKKAWHAGAAGASEGQADDAAPRVQWWLAKLDSYGTAWTFDGPHGERAGADKAAYLMPALGLQKAGEEYVVVEARITEPRPNSTGVDHGAVAQIAAIAKENGDE